MDLVKNLEGKNLDEKNLDVKSVFKVVLTQNNLCATIPSINAPSTVYPKGNLNIRETIHAPIIVANTSIIAIPKT